MEVLEFRGQVYPQFQSSGNAAQFSMPFALQVLKGETIYDIGYAKEEWKFPGAIGIDSKDNNMYDAMNLPSEKADGIHASHILEHLSDWVAALDYWTSKLKSGGVLFLYLPDYSQHYWRPFFNRKHRTYFEPKIIKDYFVASGQYHKIFVSGIDAYNSFTAFAEKI